MSKYDFDLFVIGAGSGGVRLARMSAAQGANVAVAEDRYLGGTCVNVGCVPKKLFVYASHVSEDVEDGRGYGWNLKGEMSFDWSTLLRNKNVEIERLNGIYNSLLVNSGAQVIQGRARFIDANAVEVDGKRYTAERIVIATGSWPFVPNVPGAELAITSNELFYLDKLPETATVVGGGYIAVEMAGILQGLGVETTLIYRGDLFLRGFDQEVREFVRDEITKKGIRLSFNQDIRSISRVDEHSLSIQLSNGESEKTGLVLYATGRKPYSYDLGLENTKVKLDEKSQIIVNEHYQTNESSIYAIGDVIGGMQLTPVALEEGMYLANYFYSSVKPSLVDYDLIPTAVFCQPNIATVGLSEEQALDQYENIEVYSSNFKMMKHTLSGREERTFMKMLVDKDTNKVLGVHMVGAEAGEIIQGIAVALKAGATKEHFDQTIGIHPTAAEEFVTMRQART